VYFVNQGPVYSGPGSWRKFPRAHAETPAVVYPYVGYDYPSLPYTGGPYADPVWHHVHHRYMHYQYNPYSYLPVVYTPSVGPRVIRVNNPRRTIRKSGRRLIQPQVMQDR
jgi:hypothetical protein